MFNREQITTFMVLFDGRVVSLFSLESFGWIIGGVDYFSRIRKWMLKNKHSSQIIDFEYIRYQVEQFFLLRSFYTMNRFDLVFSNYILNSLFFIFSFLFSFLCIFFGFSCIHIFNRLETVFYVKKEKVLKKKSIYARMMFFLLLKEFYKVSFLYKKRVYLKKIRKKPFIAKMFFFLFPVYYISKSSFIEKEIVVCKLGIDSFVCFLFLLIENVIEKVKLINIKNNSINFYIEQINWLLGSYGEKVFDKLNMLKLSYYAKLIWSKMNMIGKNCSLISKKIRLFRGVFKKNSFLMDCILSFFFLFFYFERKMLFRKRVKKKLMRRKKNFINRSEYKLWKKHYSSRRQKSNSIDEILNILECVVIILNFFFLINKCVSIKKQFFVLFCITNFSFVLINSFSHLVYNKTSFCFFFLGKTEILFFCLKKSISVLLEIEYCHFFCSFFFFVVQIFFFRLFDFLFKKSKSVFFLQLKRLFYSLNLKKNLLKNKKSFFPIKQSKYWYSNFFFFFI